MNTKDFSTTFLVEKTPKDAFAAINNVRGWWSEEIEGRTDKLNEVFTYHYKDIHISKIKIIEFIPDEKVVWHVMENYFNFTTDKSEWKDTKIIFEISKVNNKTQIRFIHQGLIPEYECYNICKEAWSNYIEHSLKDLIMKEIGQPNPKEGEGFNAELSEKWELNS